MLNLRYCMRCAPVRISGFYKDQQRQEKSTIRCRLPFFKRHGPRCIHSTDAADGSTSLARKNTMMLGPKGPARITRNIRSLKYLGMKHNANASKSVHVDNELNVVDENVKQQLQNEQLYPILPNSIIFMPATITSEVEKSVGFCVNTNANNSLKLNEQNAAELIHVNPAVNCGEHTSIACGGCEYPDPCGSLRPKCDDSKESKESVCKSICKDSGCSDKINAAASPCSSKKDAKKADPCGKKPDPCAKKEDPCKKKADPCAKKEDPCKKKEDPCAKKPDPCAKKPDPCAKKADPCAKKPDPCAKKPDPCAKKPDTPAKKPDPCKRDTPCSTSPQQDCDHFNPGKESIRTAPKTIQSLSNVQFSDQLDAKEQSIKKKNNSCANPCAELPNACDGLSKMTPPDGRKNRMCQDPPPRRGHCEPSQPCRISPLDIEILRAAAQSHRTDRLMQSATLKAFSTSALAMGKRSCDKTRCPTPTESLARPKHSTCEPRIGDLDKSKIVVDPFAPTPAANWKPPNIPRKK